MRARTPVRGGRVTDDTHLTLIVCEALSRSFAGGDDPATAAYRLDHQWAVAQSGRTAGIDSWLAERPPR